MLLRERLEHFCRVNGGATRILNALRDGAAVRLTVLPDTVLSFRKENGALAVAEASSDDGGGYDMEITLPAAMIDDFFAADPQTAEAIILFFADNYYREKYRPYIELKILSGVLRLTMKGYLGLIALGGPALMGILRSKGFGSIAAVTGALRGIVRK